MYLLEQQDQRSNYIYYCYYLFKTSCSNSGSERETTTLTSVFCFLTVMAFNSALLGAFFLDKSLISNPRCQVSCNSTQPGTTPLSYSPRCPLGNISDGRWFFSSSFKTYLATIKICKHITLRSWQKSNFTFPELHVQPPTVTFLNKEYRFWRFTFKKGKNNS